MTSAPAAILVLDFDGTVTMADMGDALCNRFAPPTWRDIDAEWIRNEVSLPDAQRRMWALARASRNEVLAAIHEVGRIRPGFEALLSTCEAHAIEVWLASGGFDFYIEALIGVHFPRLAQRFYNVGRLEDNRIHVEFPHRDLACDRCAVCKGHVCDRARIQGRSILFVGDGHSDRCALGHADSIAAVRDSFLARHVRETARGDTARGVTEFDRFDELTNWLAAWAS